MNYFLLTPIYRLLFGIALSKYSELTAPIIADIEQLLETKVLQIVCLLQNTGSGQNPLSILDGVYVQDRAGNFTFHYNKAPTVGQLTDVLHIISQRVADFMGFNGYPRAPSGLHRVGFGSGWSGSRKEGAIFLGNATWKSVSPEWTRVPRS